MTKLGNANSYQGWHNNKFAALNDETNAHNSQQYDNRNRGSSDSYNKGSMERERDRYNRYGSSTSQTKER